MSESIQLFVESKMPIDATANRIASHISDNVGTARIAIIDRGFFVPIDGCDVYLVQITKPFSDAVRFIRDNFLIDPDVEICFSYSKGAEDAVLTSISMAASILQFVFGDAVCLSDFGPLFVRRGLRFHIEAGKIGSWWKDACISPLQSVFGEDAIANA